MLPFIALALLAIPVVEIVVLIEVGGAIGAWNTVALLLLMAIAGTVLLRAQGVATLARVQNGLANNVFPAAELFDGACLLVAGVLMLVPGFLTDAVALPLFVPPFRALLRRAIWKRLRKNGETRVWIDGEEAPPEPPGGRRDTIDGTWHEVEPPRGDPSLDDDRPDRDGRR